MGQPSAEGFRGVAGAFVLDGNRAVVAKPFQPSHNAVQVHHAVAKRRALVAPAVYAWVGARGRCGDYFPILEMHVGQPRRQAIEGCKVVLTGQQKIAGVESDSELWSHGLANGENVLAAAVEVGPNAEILDRQCQT